MRFQELLSKVSLRTLRYLSSFGGAAICSLHLHFLCKSHFQISRKLPNHHEELMLNASRLSERFDKCGISGNNDTVSVLLPSGSIIYLQQVSAENFTEILRKVCEELKLDPENYFIIKDSRDRVRLQERDYRLEKRNRSLGLTICAKMCDGNEIKAEVRAIRDKTACAEVGDLVISVDNQLISSLRSAEEAQALLRHGTNLVLRKRDAITPQYVKSNLSLPTPLPAPSSKTSSNDTNERLAPLPPQPSSSKNRSHSMDRISDISSIPRTDRRNGSTCSSPTRSVDKNHRIPFNSHFFRIMSRSACDKTSRREERRHATLNGAEEQLLKTINELVITEENFVRDVQKLVNQYLKPTNSAVLETADRLLRIQTSFLLSLLDAAGDVAHAFIASQQQLRDSLIRISALFINKCSKFKIYSDYSAAYLRFQQNEQEHNDMRVKLEKLNVSGEQSESAQSLLIKPIQRVLKYPLFLQQIRDNCFKGSVERQQSEQALMKMQALAEYVNEMQRLTEQYGPTIEEISLKNKAVPRMNFSQLLMFAHVNWLNCPDNRSRSAPCVAFVFTSLILIYCPTLSKNKAKVYRILPIAEVEINESHLDSAQSQFVFILIHIGSSREPVYHLCCCQAEIKNHFIKSIRKAAATIAKEQRRPISGSSQSDGGYSSEKHLL
ncbi:unnamed protein product [Thelazia callipaeda]|uniref:DH domain-containing protein n=1 Tax=Thelazia callipaeda TaxID=103827 RepID=A0A0N5D0H4_THECL|nr:unnamed protein product [Thelazia callipaeda]